MVRTKDKKLRKAKAKGKVSGSFIPSSHSQIITVENLESLEMHYGCENVTKFTNHAIIPTKIRTK